MLRQVSIAAACSVLIGTVLSIQADSQTLRRCFSVAARAFAERKARVYQEPDSTFDPVLGYSRATGPRIGTPAPLDPANPTGHPQPLQCLANATSDRGPGTTPKFYCSVPGLTDEDGDTIRYKVKPHFKGPSRRNGETTGEFLSSRFSKALGFFADDEWVVDVQCPDCEKSLTRRFQDNARYTPFTTAAGVELSLGKGIDANCDGNDGGPLAQSLATLVRSGAPPAEIDAFKLWLAFIDHGDTKDSNQRFACASKPLLSADGSRGCDDPVFYIGDMGSTFGYSHSSERKATLAQWKRTVPIKMKGTTCETTAKDVGDPKVSEAGRQLLARGLGRLLDEQNRAALITNVFRASRVEERDQPPAAWAAEFERKARMIIDARCR